MIDVRDYDIALTERVKLFFDNTHFIMRPTIPIKEIRDRKLLEGNDIEFPIITVRRTNCPILNKEYNSWSRSNVGDHYLTKPNPSPLDRHNILNIDLDLAKSLISEGHRDAVSVVNSTFELTYYIDVLSFERDNFDTLIVELQENLLRLPYISFNNIKSNGTQDKLIKGQACHLSLEEVEDTSDLENFDSGNALYRATITVKLNAYIYRKFKELTVDHFNLRVIDDNSKYVLIDECITNDEGIDHEHI